MRVTVVRPLSFRTFLNERDDSANLTYFHVHAEGCKDLKHRRYANDEGWTFDAATRDEVVEDAYHDQIYSDHADEDPAELIAEYTGDFTFHNCTKGLPAHAKENTMPATATPIAERGAVAQARFDYLVAHGALEVIADGWIVNEDETAEMIDTGSGWLVRAINAKTGVVMDRWDAARTIRDWDGPIAIAS